MAEPRGPEQSQPLLVELGRAHLAGADAVTGTERTRQRARRAALRPAPAQLPTGCVTSHASRGLAGFVVSPVLQVREAAVCSGFGLWSVEVPGMPAAREGCLGRVVLSASVN